MRSEHIEGTVITKIAPKSFGTFEKQAPGIAHTFGNTCSNAYQFQLQASQGVRASERKPRVCNFRVRVSPRLTLGLPSWSGGNVFVSSRSEVRSLIYDLSCPYFLPEVMVKIKKTVEETLCDDY